LDDFEKDIFLLRFVEEMSPKEIAERYDANVNSITVRLHRLKDKVKSHFQET
jgi:RNA polymerase sigma factor (sigma-70 family)